VRGFHVRSIVKAANEGIGRNVYGAFDVAIAPQREIRQPTITRGHAKLHRCTRGRHRQIEGVFELDLLRLREPKPSGDVGKRLLCKHDRAGTHCPNGAGELNIFDGLGKALQAAAILFEKA